jgi:hypothetical protein
MCSLPPPYLTGDLRHDGEAAAPSVWREPRDAGPPGEREHASNRPLRLLTLVLAHSYARWRIGFVHIVLVVTRPGLPRFSLAMNPTGRAQNFRNLGWPRRYWRLRCDAPRYVTRPAGRASAYRSYRIKSCHVRQPQSRWNPQRWGAPNQDGAFHLGLVIYFIIIFIVPINSLAIIAAVLTQKLCFGNRPSSVGPQATHWTQINKRLFVLTQ